MQRNQLSNGWSRLWLCNSRDMENV